MFGLKFGTVYSFSLTASNEYGVSTAVTANGTTTNAPDAPYNLIVTNIASSSISISFTAPIQSVTTYNYTAVPTSGTTVSGTFSGTLTAYTINDLGLGATYTISIQSSNSDGTSIPVSVVATIPAYNNVTLTGAYTITTSTADPNYWLIAFTGNGSLISSSAVDISLNVLAVGGGGGGSSVSYTNTSGGGGGGGGVISKTYRLTAGESETISIIVGSGGSPGTGRGLNGGDTTLTYLRRTALNRIAYGGGGGGGNSGSDGNSGGSGGGGMYWATAGSGGNGGSTIASTDMVGYSSATSSQVQNAGGSAGGGAGAGSSFTTIPRNGGNGVNCTLPGFVTSWYFGAGGGGGSNWTQNRGGNGGIGGGGGGGARGTGGGSGGASGGMSLLSGTNGTQNGTSAPGGNAAPNTGSGGGGASSGSTSNVITGGTGSNGIVIISVLKSRVNILAPTASQIYATAPYYFPLNGNTTNFGTTSQTITTNASTYASVGGKSVNAISITTDTHYLYMTNLFNLANAANSGGSVSLFVYPSSYKAQSFMAFGYYPENATNGVTGTRMGLQMSNGTPRTWYFVFGSNNGENTVVVTPQGNEMALNRWTHIAITWATNSSRIATTYLYLNGTQRATSTVINIASFNSTRSDAFSRRLSLNETSGNLTRPAGFSGYVANFTYFDRTLSSSEVNILNAGFV
jgi:hypothetical protein